jgi:hypothetical protein
MHEVSTNRNTGRGIPTWLSISVVFVLSFALAAFGTMVDGWPLPRVFDEFSQILAADTFAHGRLSNPPHPLGQFFDTMHVLQRPTYASKYFPGHGLFLALGVALGGGARLGQWLAFATMGAALYWMLLGWATRRTAFLATLFFVLLMADTTWASGYWGSSVAVAGSALLFGAFRRITERPKVGDAILLGVGVFLLASTRPFEGLAVSVVPALFFAVWLLRPSPEQRARLLRVALPCSLVLCVGALFIGLHNRAVTGDPLRSGYVEYESKTPGAPPFIWQDTTLTRPRLRVTEQVRMKIDIGAYRDLRLRWGREMLERATDLTLKVYLPHIAFGALLLFAPFGMRDWRLRLATLSVLPVLVAVGLSSFYLPAYIGPAIPPLILAYLAGCGVVWRFSLSGRPVGRALMILVLIALGTLGARRIVDRDDNESDYANAQHWTRQRAEIETRVAATPGTHLILVRYGEEYRAQNEWVQNGADLHGARILWAHDRGKVENEALLQLDRRRTVWRLVIDGRRELQLKLRPYVPLESQLD